MPLGIVGTAAICDAVDSAPTLAPSWPRSQNRLAVGNNGNEVPPCRPRRFISRRYLCRSLGDRTPPTGAGGRFLHGGRRSRKGPRHERSPTSASTPRQPKPPNRAAPADRSRGCDSTNADPQRDRPGAWSKAVKLDGVPLDSERTDSGVQADRWRPPVCPTRRRPVLRREAACRRRIDPWG